MNLEIQATIARIVVIACAAAAPLTPALAQNTLTEKDVARLQAVRSAAISPDGRFVAFTRLVPRDPYARGDEFDDGGAWTELHVLDLSTRNEKPFVTGSVTVGSVEWTPDGSGISFLAKRGDDEHRCLYVIPVDGGEAQNVLSHDTDVSAYSWSPDGRRVAFLATEKKPKDKKKMADKGFNQEVYEEDFDFTRVWIAAIDAPGESKSDDPRMLELGGSASELHWSPAGDRLVVALAPTPLIDDYYMKRKVHVVDVESGESVARFDNPGKLGQLAWSPDGRHVAMISGADVNDPAEGRLMVVSADGGGLRDVLPNLEAHVSAIAWQKADTIMYVADVGVASMLAKVSVDGREKKTLAEPCEVIFRALSLARDGMSGALVGSTAAHPSEVFFTKHGDAAPKRLTDSNPWLGDRRLAEQEVVRFKARDGLELEGILIRPLDEGPGQRYPLILYVHGGPEAHESNGWKTGYSRPGQVAAARGFAVFYPNYRGSTGRGVAFSKISQGDEAGAEFDDLVDAVKHLVDLGLVDEKKVGITGGSYGGYASAWGATALSEHFAASVMFVGISNAISKKGTTDIPNEDYLVHVNYHLWDDKWDFALSRSPVFHVEKAKTPLLILHGKEDPRVHPGQSMELYRHMRTLGQTPVRLVWYPGEGHGNRRAASRLDYNLRMMRWMEHYLKGPGGDPPPLEIDYGFNEDESNDETDDAGDE